MEGTPPTAAIYLFALLAITIMLIILYVCISKGCCWCCRKEKENDGVTYKECPLEDINSQMDIDSDDMDGYTESIPPSSPTEQYRSEPDLQQQQQRYLHAQLPDTCAASDPGIAMSAYGDKPANKRKFKFNRKKGEKKAFESEATLSLSLKHSSTDYYLMICIHSINELDVKAIPQVCVKLVFLPDKKYATKTRYVDTSLGRLEQYFKFAAVKRSDLFESAVRFRVYGRNYKYGVQLGGEKFLGETTVQLADVAQCEGTLSTERKLGAKGSSVIDK